MKTAISIPDNVFESAEKLADALGQSRSQLYTNALAIYITNHQSEDVIRKLDEVYGQADSGLPRDVTALQSQSLSSREW